jgi:hypothetical protein
METESLFDRHHNAFIDSIDPKWTLAFIAILLVSRLIKRPS